MTCDLISMLLHAYTPSLTNIEVPLLHKNSICIQVLLTCKICDVYHFSLSPRHHSSGMISSSLNDCIIITPNKWPWLIAHLLDMGLRAILRHKRTWCTIQYWKDTLYQTCKALDKDRFQHAHLTSLTFLASWISFCIWSSSLTRANFRGSCAASRVCCFVRMESFATNRHSGTAPGMPPALSICWWPLISKLYESYTTLRSTWSKEYGTACSMNCTVCQVTRHGCLHYICIHVLSAVHMSCSWAYWQSQLGAVKSCCVVPTQAMLTFLTVKMTSSVVAFPPFAAPAATALHIVSTT